MRYGSCLAVVPLVLLLSAGSAFAQSARKEGHIGRIVGTIGGAVGGFFLGWAVSDDDAINSTEKLTRNVLIGAAAGGVGGYFLGRAIDKHRTFAYATGQQATRMARLRLEEAAEKGVATGMASEPVLSTEQAIREQLVQNSCDWCYSLACETGPTNIANTTNREQERSR